MTPKGHYEFNWPLGSPVFWGSFILDIMITFDFGIPSKQWAALKICILLITTPAQNWKLFLDAPRLKILGGPKVLFNNNICMWVVDFTVQCAWCIYGFTVAIVFELVYYTNGRFLGMADIHEYWFKIPCPPTRFSWAKSHNFLHNGKSKIHSVIQHFLKHVPFILCRSGNFNKCWKWIFIFQLEKIMRFPWKSD